MAKELESGTIVDVREVIIDGRTSVLGTATGTLSGAVAGSQIGGSLGDLSSGAATGAAGGAIAGAVIGPKVEKALTSKRAQELTVLMDSGGLIVVTQELRKPWFNIGDPVKVDTSMSGAGRVYHAYEDSFIDPDTGAYLPEDFEIPTE
jgi:outer membrane lipoprotein SlyB